MKKSLASKTSRQSRELRSRESSSGRSGISIAPPKYGIDLVDRGPAGAEPLSALSPSLSGGAPLAGDAPGLAEDYPQAVGGVMDTVRDIGDSVSTGVGNIVGAGAALVTGIDINTVNNVGPTWYDHGRFYWYVNWNLSGRNVGATTNGWMVQHVENAYRGEDSAGVAIDNARVGTTPSYYEAWPVVAGAVHRFPRDASAGRDYWKRPDLSVLPSVADAGTKGRWSMRGKVYFTTTDPTTHGLASGNVADAGALPSAVGAPPDLGVARLHRYANGTWDSTAAPRTHTGSNR